MCRSTEGSAGRVLEERWDSGQPIPFMSYKIINIRNRGLKSALRGMSEVNVDLGIFQEAVVVAGGFM